MIAFHLSETLQKQSLFANERFNFLSLTHSYSWHSDFPSALKPLATAVAKTGCYVQIDERAFR
jgi:hypothetical protein